MVFVDATVIRSFHIVEFQYPL